MCQRSNWCYIFSKFVAKYRLKFVVILLSLCLVESVYVAGISLLPSLAVVLIQAKNLKLAMVILTILLAGVGVYAIRIFDLFLQQRLTLLTFDFRFDYVPVFSEHIFGWQQSLIDSVEGKTVIDQGYEAIYNGQNVGIGAIIAQTVTLIRTGCQIVVLLCMMGFLSIWPAAIVLGLNLLQYGFQRIGNQWYFKHKKEQNRITSYQSYFVRTLMKRSTGKDIRLFSMFDLFHHHFMDLIQKLVTWQRHYSNLSLVINLGQRLVNVIGLALSLLILIALQNVSVAALLFAISAIQTLNLNFGNFRDAYVKVGKNLVFVDNFRKFMAFPYRQDQDSIENKVSGSGKIEVRDLAYAVNGVSLVHDINFSVKRGEKVALVGENGAGKSTLIKLLCGLYTPSSGSVSIDGQNIATWAPATMRQRVAVEFQDDVILHFTIAENVACTTPQQINSARVEAVLDEVGLGDFVAGLSNGIQTFIGNELNENGIQLSGGQKDKILFARVLYRQADINILDEPTSALDPISEKQFYALVDAKLNQKTTIIVTHRLGALATDDVKILVMKDGTVIAAGSHRWLLANCEYYCKLWSAQRSLYVGGDHH
ncbi:multidrug ABC transporter ATP-binding protein [Lacticaseibacillus chiayiensis]|nr:multidrug ABC transporter ATP-binding protein [Lacticaseibacillus chiayiensis]